MKFDNKVKVEIGGRGYILNTTEDEEYVRSIAEEIDAQVRELLLKGNNLSLNEALVLCVLGYCDYYKKERANTDNMRAQLKEYLDEAEKCRSETEAAKRKVQRLKKEIEKLKAEKAE